MYAVYCLPLILIFTCRSRGIRHRIRTPTKLGAEVVSRRKFFKFLGWGNFTAALGLTFGPGLVRYLYPRVLFEPSSILKQASRQNTPQGALAKSLKKNRLAFGLSERKMENSTHY